MIYSFSEYSLIVESLDNPHPIIEIPIANVINHDGTKKYVLNSDAMDKAGYTNPRYYSIGDSRENGYFTTYDKGKITEIHHIDKHLNSTAEFENAPGNFKFVGAAFGLAKNLVNDGRTVSIRTRHDVIDKYHRMAKLACRNEPHYVGDIVKDQEKMSSFVIKKAAYGEIMEANYVLTNLTYLKKTGIIQS